MIGSTIRQWCGRLFITACAVTFSQVASASLILTGVVDGPLPGGVPKDIEVFATTNIPDLSVYGLESANNLTRGGISPGSVSESVIGVMVLPLAS